MNEADVGFIASDFLPQSRSVPMLIRSTRIGEPAIHVLANPGRGLLTKTRNQQGHRLISLRQQTSTFGQAAFTLDAQ
ncbi:hypothetical protein [Pseudomonas sp. BGI-2]|uniref:hypothetical protein n=1 Tax=Pseudomonas sp. BGI-2 TaxID=2528211 RepID=UPI002115CD64|nr:hypothetical protein [Pseudomonas sp. BGI-2]